MPLRQMARMQLPTRSSTRDPDAFKSAHED
jgi:hypothetical protein